MPQPEPAALHATAVAIRRRALLIFGPSRAGKSSLAAALIAGSRPGRRIELIGDDRVVLWPRRAGGARQTLAARPHPRIAGFMERRGLGLVAVPFRAEAPVAALVELTDPIDLAGAPAPDALRGLPVLRLAGCPSPARGAERVLDWWTCVVPARAGVAAATERPQLAGKLR